MVETSTGRMVAKEFGADYFECSAKTGCMVEEAFIATATKVRRSCRRLSSQPGVLAAGSAASQA
ncbi:unnamed protein product, partial [Hapterophycus canaliculatus]